MNLPDQLQLRSWRYVASRTDITLLREKIDDGNAILWYYARCLTLKALYAELALQLS